MKPAAILSEKILRGCEIRVGFLGATECRRMMPLKPSGRSTFKNCVKHLVVDNIAHNKSRHAGLVKHRAQCDRVMHRIIVAQALPAIPKPPSYPVNIDLIAKIAMIELPINFSQRMMFAGFFGEMLPPFSQLSRRPASKIKTIPDFIEFSISYPFYILIRAMDV